MLANHIAGVLDGTPVTIDMPAPNALASTSPMESADSPNKDFIRTVVAGGSHTDQVKTPHGLDRKEYIGIDIEITPTEIVHSVLRGREWVVIDKWDFPEGSVHGKFGFSIPGKDEIGLKDFTLTH